MVGYHYLALPTGHKRDTATEVDMARRIRANLEDRTNRLRLAIARKPVFARIGPGVSVGYRRNATAGTWVVRAADGKGGAWTKAVGTADDYDAADGSRVLDFWQAQDRARSIARVGRGGEGDDGKPLTVGAALDRYAADLQARGGDHGNVLRVRGHISAHLALRPVTLLSGAELGRWRNVLAKGMAAASVNRVVTVLRAALNLAADGDERISNRSAWDIGLKAIPDATESRNVVLSDDGVRAVVEAAAQISAEFRMLIEVAAITGARFSQLAALQVRDLKSDQLFMPTSRKGRGQKKITRRQVPISRELSARLSSLAKGGPTNPLLTKPSGEPWKKSDQARPFRIVARHAGFDPSTVTLNCLRHSSITRAIKAGVPIRIVAALHDTSVAMIEKTYSAHIDQHVDSIARPALLDLG